MHLLGITASAGSVLLMHKDITQLVLAEINCYLHAYKALLILLMLIHMCADTGKIWRTGAALRFTELCRQLCVYVMCEFKSLCAPIRKPMSSFSHSMKLFIQLSAQWISTGQPLNVTSFPEAHFFYASYSIYIYIYKGREREREF